MAFHKLYYKIKPVIPRPMQLFLRRKLVRIRRKKYRDIWPIDHDSSNPPEGWKGWPEGKRFALVLTHDVDSPQGVEKCIALAKMEENLGFRSSFNFVAEKYHTPVDLRKYLTENGFEIGIHGLYHDGKYFDSKEEFLKRADRINWYLNDWNVVGFRTPSMLHNLEWLHALNIQYDSSTFDTDPFEPQSDGIGTIFPFFVSSKNGKKGYVELPYTLPQDFTLFILMREKTINIWKKKLDWIVENGGMALINVHPDYIDFGSNHNIFESYPAVFYKDFLEYVRTKYDGLYWHPLPVGMSRFCVKCKP
jgi:peptidoglycan/xylan/chitin deacetylase (PgdA/CDA1 family)